MGRIYFTPIEEPNPFISLIVTFAGPYHFPTFPLNERRRKINAGFSCGSLIVLVIQYFATQYQEVPESRRPLGEEPVLVSKIQIKPGPDNNQVLCMHPEQGQGLEIAFDPTLLHSFCKLLVEGVKKTDWDLEYRISEDVSPVSQTTH